MAITKAERELESKEVSDERRRRKDRSKKLQVREMMGAAVIGTAIGAMKVRTPSIIEGFGPGDRLKLDYILAGGGLYLAFKGKNSMREYGSAAAVIGIARLTEGLGERLASGFGAGE